MVKVNLLKKSRLISEKQYQLERKVLFFAVVLFVVVLTITMAFFAWQVFLNVRLGVVEKKIAQDTVALQGLSAASTQQLYIKSRLQHILTFMKGRAETREALQRVFSLPIEGVTVSSVSFDDQSVLKMQTVAISAQSFDNLYKYFEGSNDFFTQIVNDGVSRSQDGSYSMMMSLTLPLAKMGAEK